MIRSLSVWFWVSWLRKKRFMIRKDVAHLFPSKNSRKYYNWIVKVCYWIQYEQHNIEESSRTISIYTCWLNTRGVEKNAGIWSIYLSRSDAYMLLLVVYTHTHAFSFILVHAHTYAFSFVLVHCTKLPWVLGELLNLSGNRMSLKVRVSVSIF